jgi:hypothetical protein
LLFFTSKVWSFLLLKFCFSHFWTKNLGLDLGSGVM